MALAIGGGAGLINMLVDACEEKGIELMLNTKGTSLITDDTAPWWARSPRPRIPSSPSTPRA